MTPPFDITDKALHLLAELGRLVGRLEGLPSVIPKLQLRRQNQIRTVQGSVAIEGNTLSLEQVTAVFEGQRVSGPPKDVLEVKNALAAYAQLPRLKPFSEKSLLHAHRLLMRGLANDAGQYRHGDVGIFRGREVTHVAPPSRRVPALMQELFAFAEKSAAPLWIKAAVFHYELEFIHPFSDGNGRIGRLWHHRLLQHDHPVFESVPLESTIKRRQAEYYRALAASDDAGKSTAFIEFSLSVLVESLGEFIAALRPEPMTSASRLAQARAHFGRQAFRRKDYLDFFKTVSTATASRDLASAVKQRWVLSQGEHALTTYRFHKASQREAAMSEVEPLVLLRTKTRKVSPSLR